MRALYNEIDGYAADWLRNLGEAGHIAAGDVDERSIADLAPADLKGRTQAHFFAGIGVWSAALRAAGWPDDRPVWTGSCPCQPFSGAGKRKGVADDRHLWPDWFWLIRQCRPAIIFGEQVASPDALVWLDAVFADLEGAGYACAAVDFCAASVGAPHWRQRLYWMAHATQQQLHGSRHGRAGGWLEYSERSGVERLADTSSAGLPPRERPQLPGPDRHDQGRATEQRGGASGRMAHANRDGRQQGRAAAATARHGDTALADGGHGRPGPVNGFWRDADWLRCTDGKWRPVEPGTRPLAHGVAGRVGQLRAYGNAIVLPQATAFVKAAMQVI